jgi:predicted dehydrogenase
MIHRVAVVGLGAIARIHLEALTNLSAVDVTAGADIRGDATLMFRGRPRPVYTSVEELVAAHELDDIIVATPTSSHAEVCRRIAELDTTARILCEKPLAVTEDEVDHLLEIGAMRPGGLEVLYHFRHAPEVRWAAAHLPGLARRHGGVVHAVCSFLDPYITLDPTARATYVSSWLDSGINALSVLDLLVEVREVAAFTPVHGMFETYQATIDFRSGNASGVGHVLTSWHAGQSSKQSHLRFEDGTTLTMDHSAMVAWVAGAGAGDTPAGSGAPPGMSRQMAHYSAMFEEVFADGHQSAMDRHKRLHRLLLTPASHAHTDGREPSIRATAGPGAPQA